MRRLFPALLPAVCLPLALLVVISGHNPSGPRTRLVNSWVDPRGAGHLDFDVRGVAPGAVLTARLVLHRPPNGPTAAVRVTAASGDWSAYVNWLANSGTATTRTVSELANDAVSIDVSDEVRRDGLISFLLSNPAFATPPNVVLSSDAGADAPTLIVQEAADDPSAAGSGDPVATPGPTPGSTASADPGTTEPSPSPSSDVPPSQTPSPTTGAASGDPGVSDPQGPSDPTLPINLNPPPTVLTPEPTDPPSSPGPCTVSPLLVPSCGVWWGIGAVPLGSEGWNQAITDFDTTQNRSSDLLHYYHVGAGNFPTPLEISRSLENGQHRVLLENWKPELGRTWAQVAAGDPAVDAEIDDEANYLRNNYTTPFFLAVHHEPENEIIASEGSGYTAADYAAMYRHVVLRLKADGVTNAVFVMNYMGSPNWGEKSWFNDLYPGDDVVDWIAEDPYSIGGGGIWRAGLRRHRQPSRRLIVARLLHLGHDQPSRQAAHARRMGSDRGSLESCCKDGLLQHHALRARVVPGPQGPGLLELTGLRSRRRHPYRLRPLLAGGLPAARLEPAVPRLDALNSERVSRTLDMQPGSCVSSRSCSRPAA